MVSVVMLKEIKELCRNPDSNVFQLAPGKASRN